MMIHMCDETYSCMMVHGHVGLYMVMCDEYGIELTEEHLKEVRSISNDNGEVTISIFIQSFKLFFLMMFSGQGFSHQHSCQK